MKWLWKARCTRIIDGDTIEVQIDVGFNAIRTERLRLLGVNCPETKGESRADGLEAKEFTIGWLNQYQTGVWPLIVETTKSDSFGRYLARVWSATEEAGMTNDNDLASALLKSGHAVPFMVGF